MRLNLHVRCRRYSPSAFTTLCIYLGALTLLPSTSGARQTQPSTPAAEAISDEALLAFSARLANAIDHRDVAAATSFFDFDFMFAAMDAARKENPDYFTKNSHQMATDFAKQLVEQMIASLGEDGGYNLIRKDENLSSATAPAK